MASLAFALAATFAQAQGREQAHDHASPPSDTNTGQVRSPLSHLVFFNGAIHADVTWEQGPQMPNESILKIAWRDGASRLPIEPTGRFKMELWMPSMGHGSAPVKIGRYVDAQGRDVFGSYKVAGIFFLMSGAWEVRVTLAETPTNGNEETRIIPVRIEQAGSHRH